MSQQELGISIPAPQRPAWADEENVIWLVGISGGKDGEAALLHLLHETGIPREQIRVVFADTENEHQWTYDHVAYIHREFFPVQTLKPERGFFDLAFFKRRFPSAKARFCTEALKIDVCQDHVQYLRLQGYRVISVSGVRADESEDRSDLTEWDFSGTLLCNQWRPLIRWTLADVLALHEKHGLRLNPLYAWGAHRVGCFPCIMSNKAEIRTIALHFPERIDAIRKAENEFEENYGRYSSFFAMEKVPPRFRTKPFTTENGEKINVATIDDVVRWSMTGKGAEGSWEDDPKEPISCKSGFCE